LSLRPLAPIAKRQLAAWETVARVWVLIPVYLATQEGHRLGPEVYQLHYTCGGYPDHLDQDPPLGGCGQAIYCIDTGSGPFHTCADHILAAVTAHIRNVHRDLEEMVYNHA
jgi:hypothetical protein